MSSTNESGKSPEDVANPAFASDAQREHPPAHEPPAASDGRGTTAPGARVPGGHAAPPEPREGLRQSEERLRFATHAAQMYSWEVDLAQRSFVASDNAEQVVGHPLPQSLEDLWTCPHPEDAAAVKAAFDQAIASQGEFQVEYRVAGHAPDDERWVFSAGRVLAGADGTPARVVGVTQNITARKRAEERLRESEQRTRALSEHLPSGAAFIVDRDLRYLLARGEALLTVGMQPADFEGKTLHEALPPEKVDHHAENYRRALAGECFEVEHSEGGRDFVTHGTPLVNAQGQVYAALAVSYDVTVRKRAEELARQTEQTKQANAAKTEFLSRVSHELRTPLNAILGFGQIMELTARGQSDTDCLKHILNAGRHLLKLVDDVLDITSIENGRWKFTLEPVRLDELLPEVIDLLGPMAARHHVTLHPFVASAARLAGNAPVLADRQRLKQVLFNLLSNAVKYNVAAGSVRVDCVRATAGGRVRVRVAGTGPGVGLEMRPRLFTPFDRLGIMGCEVEGTGLGLALCKGMIEAMGGIIGYEETPEGTDEPAKYFWIELPLVGRNSGF